MEENALPVKKILIPLFALAILLIGCGNGSSVEKQASRAIRALKHGDMQALSQLVHPKKGVRFTPVTYVNTGRNIFFYAEDLPGVMEDETVHRWGEYDGTGDPIHLTFAMYYEDFLYDHDYAKAPQVTWNQKMEHGSMIDNAEDVYPDAQVVEYYFPGFEEKYGGLDWASLRLIWEELDGNWYLVGVIHDQWSP